jgi:hypothetical protein
MPQQSARVKTYSLAGTTPTWFPNATSITGTLTSANTRVIGTGTSFKSEIKAGDFLVNSSNVARKVHDVVSDTELTLELEFAADLNGATCVRVENQVLRHLKVWFITNAGTMKCASQDTAAAVPASYDWSTQSDDTYQEPQLVTPGAGGAVVLETI